MTQDIECHNSDIIASSTCTKALIALGGNVKSHFGPPAITLRHAIKRLDDSQLSVVEISRFYATPCFPAGAGPDYVNAAAILSGTLSALEVLKLLHEVEAEFGRERQQRWGQRTLDLDLLAYGDSILPDSVTYLAWRDLPPDGQRTSAPDQLILPHPRMQDRAFVLIPLRDIAPDWVHPVTGLSVRQMADALPEAEKTLVQPL